MSLLATAMQEFQAHPQSIDKFCESLRPELIEEALEATGTASIRRRKLPADQVVWLVVGMSMYTNGSIRQTLDRLNLTINGKVVPSSISDARKKLGPKPISYLFDKLAKSWTKKDEASCWRGLQLFGIDGTVLCVPDSDDNYTYFGKPGSPQGEAAYPQTRIVATMDLGLRLLHSARIGTLAQGENTLAKDIFDGLPTDSLCLMDRGFMSFAHFFKIENGSSNRHFLCRARGNSRFELLERLSDGSALAKLHATRQALEKSPDMDPEITVRMIEYKVEGGDKTIRLFTSLLDPKLYPGKSLAHLYHERWEMEVAFDELKTDMLNRKECLRSKSPKELNKKFGPCC